MSKNIQTHNAKIDLIKKFLNYANIADASYAMLHFVDDTIECVSLTSCKNCFSNSGVNPLG